MIVKHKTQSLKITQIDEDTTLFLKSKEEIRTPLNIIDLKKNFGLQLKENKTKGIRIGKLKDCRNKVD